MEGVFGDFLLKTCGILHYIRREWREVYNEKMTPDISVLAFLDKPLVEAVNSYAYERAIELSEHEQEPVCSAALSILVRTKRESMPQKYSLELLNALCKPDGAKVSSKHLRYCLDNGHTHLFDDLIGHAMKQSGIKKTAAMITEQLSGDWRGRLQAAKADAILLALEGGHYDPLVKMMGILDRAKVPYSHERNLIHSAVAMDFFSDVREGKIKSVEFLLDKGWSLETSDREGNLPIHLVVSVEMTRLLIERGADIRAKGARGNRPLYSLWLRRSKYNMSEDETPSEQEIINIAKLMIEHGAQWKDAPTIDIMELQIQGHALSEFLINGRRRHELGKLVEKIQVPNSEPKDQQSSQRRRMAM